MKTKAQGALLMNLYYNFLKSKLLEGVAALLAPRVSATAQEFSITFV